MNLVFDIGANIGNTVRIFIKHSKKVIAFEPNPILKSKLSKMFEGDNVVIDTRAISNKNGTQILNISSSFSISTFSDEWINNSRFSLNSIWDYPTEVETATLNQIIYEYGVPDYIKIDVEGFEYEIITAFDKFLPKTIFSFEWAEEMQEKIKLSINHAYNLGYKSFAYTDGDEVLFDYEINWIGYEELINEIETFIPERKFRWGMIYFKK